MPFFIKISLYFSVILLLLLLFQDINVSLFTAHLVQSNPDINLIFLAFNAMDWD
jgi:hypothetical protein